MLACDSSANDTRYPTKTSNAPQTLRPINVICSSTTVEGASHFAMMVRLPVPNGIPSFDTLTVTSQVPAISRLPLPL